MSHGAKASQWWFDEAIDMDNSISWPTATMMSIDGLFVFGPGHTWLIRDPLGDLWCDWEWID